MEIHRMQQQVDEWISAETSGYWSPLSMMARLTEETGELARLLNHVYGEKKKKPQEAHDSIEGELGDLLFTIACICNALDIDLESAVTKTLEKVQVRDRGRFTG